MTNTNRMPFEIGVPSHWLPPSVCDDLARIAELPSGRAWQEVSAALDVRLTALEHARATHESRHPLHRQIVDAVAGRTRAALGLPAGISDTRWTHDDEASVLVDSVRAYLSLAENVLGTMWSVDPSFAFSHRNPSAHTGFLALVPNPHPSAGVPWSETSQEQTDTLPWNFINHIGDGFYVKARNIGYDPRGVLRVPVSREEFVRLVLRDFHARFDLHGTRSFAVYRLRQRVVHGPGWHTNP